MSRLQWILRNGDMQLVSTKDECPAIIKMLRDDDDRPVFLVTASKMGSFENTRHETVLEDAMNWAENEVERLNEDYLWDRGMWEHELFSNNVGSKVDIAA